MNTDLLQSKQHFQILDGLRGVAALAIVIFHFMEMVFEFSKNFIGHGFLAVDFFFCLSGFVIAYAYDNRIAGMGTWEFFKGRLIRLHPLIVFGSALGLVSFLIDPFSAYSNVYSAGKLALMSLASIFLIPLPIAEERSFNLFTLNAPTWSLFWEYIVNIFYALILYRLSRRPLLLLTVIAGLILCFVSFRAGNLLGGWSGGTFWDGGARVCYSFMIGMLIFRSNWIIKNKLGFAGLAALLSLAFIMPYSDWNWLTEAIVVLFYFPLIVALGAGATVSPEMRKLCEFSGNISYPLYMTHYMVIWVFLNYYTAYKPETAQLTLIIIIGTMLLIAFAYLVMMFYDIPIRSYLVRIRKQKLR
ncbi:acyltransferase family protein [Daejeonella lutea]|uniref:Peptidoglycan/LPS O-acetylase OafA/YrhL, contains acyltransferase and SGNH-hydrolase domains n=1 Tax=Daejeonella lutea TaxID=572036 RepID=A0A1T5BIN2_9SPHI|nr:acyltransferase [Daejeonella lutea]SKB47182.1 Peptidoglycan/LPS O-acetylase OafA/YrhL, contains acyltransferase and SGNH-hydrolase domains [Daejeonella lutea]